MIIIEGDSGRKDSADLTHSGQCPISVDFQVLDCQFPNVDAFVLLDGRCPASASVILRNIYTLRLGYMPYMTALSGVSRFLAGA